MSGENAFISRENFDSDSKRFLEEDYKLKVAYLESHFERLWTRFNFLLTIQLALFGFLGYLLFDPNAKSVEAALTPIFLGLAASLLWYVIGAQDRYLVEAYRESVAGLARVIADYTSGLGWYGDYYVGSKKGIPKPYQYVKKRNIWERVTGWYWEDFSITKLAAIMPMITFVLWCIALVMQCFEVYIFSGNVSPN